MISSVDLHCITPSHHLLTSTFDWHCKIKCQSSPFIAEQCHAKSQYLQPCLHTIPKCVSDASRHHRPPHIEDSFNNVLCVCSSSSATEHPQFILKISYLWCGRGFGIFYSLFHHLLACQHRIDPRWITVYCVAAIIRSKDLMLIRLLDSHCAHESCLFRVDHLLCSWIMFRFVAWPSCKSVVCLLRLLSASVRCIFSDLALYYFQCLAILQCSPTAFLPIEGCAADW